MASTDAQTPPQNPSKRKPDSDEDPRVSSTTKMPRLDEASSENGEAENAAGKAIIIEHQQQQQEVEVNVNCNISSIEKIIEQEDEVQVSENNNSDDKGKGKMNEQEEDENPDSGSVQKVLIDKGKGKMIEEESESESDDLREDISDLSDYSDDPLMEVDLNNILPSRTRNFAPSVPGAYLVQEYEEDQESEDEIEDEEINDESDEDDEEEDSDDDE